MKINRIKLVNFRNYSNVVVSFNKKMNIFIGDNAQGKTNLLESIVILALTKSHRVGNNFNIIKFGKSKSKITGVVKNNKIISKLSLEIDNEGKKVMVNGNNIKKIADYISYLNVIVFTPDDLEIVKGSPNIRRNLLNIELSQISKEYIKIYNEYNKLLKTRNEYLKVLFENNIADKAYLDILSDKLIEKAIFIYQKRKEYINLVNIYINKYYKYITGSDGVVVKYIPNITLEDYDYESIRKKLKHTFKKNYLKELNYGMTIFGPHRDDFYFEYKGNDLKFYGSQGQQKLAILSFKLAEISIFKEFTRTSPVLLLDDIFSELDVKKRNKLLKIINEDDIQSIITTTDLRNINKKYIELSDVKRLITKAYLFKVSNGIIERK